MTNEQKRLINSEFYKCDTYQSEVKATLDGAIYSGTTVDYSSLRVSGGGGSNGVENRVIKALNDSQYKSLWVQVFNYTLIKYTGEYKDRLIRMKYIERCSRRQICGKLHIGTATYHRWLDEILETAYMWCRNLKIL